MSDSPQFHRISLKDVAAKAGVHYSTVSLALENSPKLPLATRERVQKVAQEMGYRPDAALSALNAYRRVRMGARYQSTIALVSDNPKWAEYHTGTHQWAGMQAQARKLGHEVEPFYLGYDGLTEERLAKVLHSRNIQGVLFGTMQHPNKVLSLPWERFSCVSSGFTLKSPDFHRVSSAHLRNALRGLSKVWEMGYRRVGVGMLAEIHERTNESFGAAYDTFSRKHKEMKSLPFFMPEDFDRDYTPEKLLAWIRKNRVEVLLTPHNENLKDLQQKLGMRIPEEIGLVNIGCARPDDEKSGIFESNELIGRTMINLVVGMMHRDERGIPSIPMQTMIDGQWVEGTSLRWLKAPEERPAKRRARSTGVAVR